MARLHMGTSLVKRNTVIFFISMSLVLLLAAGVYASNRLITHWLLVRGLELAYSDKQTVVADLLSAHSDTGASYGVGDPTGLRLSAPATPDPAFLTEKMKRLAEELHPESGSTRVLEAALVLPDTDNDIQTTQHAQGGVEWATKPRFLSTRTQINAEMAVRSRDTVAAIPDMSFTGELGSTALITFPAKDASSPGLIVLVTTDQILKSLAPLLWSISISVGVLCLASFVFAGILLWMRFRDQLQTTRNIQYLAHHDTLTGLPNRAVFNARLTEALRLAHAKASNIGVMIIDVDKFKEINDTHGHATGDVFLQIIAERLKAVFANHLVARLSGDEFAVMLTSISDPGRMTRLAADMINATEAPCSIDGREIKISLSIGLARATDGSWRSSRLLHCADLALYKAKHSGRSTFAWYTPELDADAQKRKEVEVGLVKALKFDQFKLLYQPQYASKTACSKATKR